MTGLAANPGRVRRPLSFSVSLLAHGIVLGWVAIWPAIPPPPPASAYERFIKPQENHIVWYKLADKLPEIRPAEAKGSREPPRAKLKFDQNIVAGKRDTSRVPQLIWAPVPEIEVPLPLPNVVAMAPPAPPPRPVRAFIPPPVPPPKPVPETKPAMPDAPEIPAVPKPVKDLAVASLPARAPARRFAAPASPKPVEAPAVPLPAAPDLQPEIANAVLPADLTKVQKRFVPPANRPALRGATEAIAVEPPAPTFNGPPTASASLAIVGLDPAKTAEPPAPPGSRPAAFSAGPKTNPKGGQGGSDGALVEVPSLTVQGGARENKPIIVASLSPTSKENLAAAALAARGGVPVAPPPGPGAVRVSEAPDPRLYGRAVYTMAIQMPNITSHSGSWMVWFAQHEAEPGDAPLEVQPPKPLLKVDPRYVPSAADERIEGKVRLWAVIGKDGHVGSVTLVSHLDERLDRSAIEALTKWLFQPATVNGRPVELDAVFEVPFRLAPKPTR